jgi:hypothetical protein
MKINSDIVSHLNQELRSAGVGFYYTMADLGSNNPTIRIEVIDNAGFVDSSIVNCTNDYYNWLDKWFMDNYKIKICYNNTRSIIWSDDFS